MPMYRDDCTEGLKRLKADAEELRVLSHVKLTVVPGLNDCETPKLYWLVCMPKPASPVVVVPTPDKNGLLIGTTCESIDTVPVTSGSKPSAGTLAVEKGKLAPAVPRPTPPPAVASRSVSANQTL